MEYASLANDLNLALAGSKREASLGATIFGMGSVLICTPEGADV
jgi:hypothetical protein